MPPPASRWPAHPGACYNRNDPTLAPKGHALFRRSLDAPYWLALLSASPLNRALAKRIVHKWCLEENQPLATLFQLPESELAHGMNLSERDAALLRAAERLAPDQALLLDELAAIDVRMATRVDVAYPDAFGERLPEDRLPYFLFYRGNIGLLSQPGTTFLGAENPSPAARALVSALAGSLAAGKHHLLGGYAQGLDRLALETARTGDGRVTMVLPVGIRVFARALAALEPDIATGRLLVVSPMGPDATGGDAAARARLTLAAALGDALVLVEPPLTPSELLPEGGLRGPGWGAFVWADSGDPITALWLEAGARPFSTAEQAAALLADHLGVHPAELDKDGGTIDDLPGVEPIVFDDADDAISSLGRSGHVPDALARRLRERDWTND